MSNELLVEREGRRLTLTLNRPQEANRVSNDMVLEMTRLLLSAHESYDYVVLRANGRDFCTGWAGGAVMKGPGEAYERRHVYDMVFDCYGSFRRCRVPVVGVVHGPARGFGCAIAALCDVTIAADSAIFQIPEMNHNIMPTMVMSSLLDRMPLKAITYLTYSAADFSAAEALAWGVVSKVVPAAGLDKAVAEFCATLAARPRPSLAGVKDYLRSAISMDMQGAVDYARNLHTTINTSSEMQQK